MASQPLWIPPMLAVLAQETPRDEGWVFERKIDGYRALAFLRKGRVRLLSRNQLTFNQDFPDVVTALADQAPANCILDGEVVAIHEGVQVFGALQRRGKPASRREGVQFGYIVFDLLWLEGRDWTSAPLEERRAQLQQAVNWGGPLAFSATLEGPIAEIYAGACRLKWEGLIGKRVGSLYRSRRSSDWRKYKCLQRQEFVIAGYTDPGGSRLGFGALVLGYYEGSRLCYAGKVGTGFNAALLKSLSSQLKNLERTTSPFAAGETPKLAGVHWVSPSLVGEVSFTEWTPDGHLRHPAFQGLRPDKRAREVIREG